MMLKRVARVIDVVYEDDSFGDDQYVFPHTGYKNVYAQRMYDGYRVWCTNVDGQSGEEHKNDQPGGMVHDGRFLGMVRDVYEYGMSVMLVSGPSLEGNWFKRMIHMLTGKQCKDSTQWVNWIEDGPRLAEFRDIHTPGLNDGPGRDDAWFRFIDDGTSYRGAWHGNARVLLDMDAVLDDASAAVLYLEVCLEMRIYPWNVYDDYDLDDDEAMRLDLDVDEYDKYCRDRCAYIIGPFTCGEIMDELSDPTIQNQPGMQGIMNGLLMVSMATRHGEPIQPMIAQWREHQAALATGDNTGRIRAPEPTAPTEPDDSTGTTEPTA